MEDQKPLEDLQDPALNPEQSPTEQYPEESSWGLKLAIVVFVMVAGIAGAYGWLQHNTAQQLASERAELSAALAQSL